MCIKEQVSNDDVVRLASDCLKGYIDEKGWTKASEVITNITDIYEVVIYPRYEISLNTDCDLGMHNDQKVLGKMLSKERVILIDKSINKQSEDSRYTFTLGHEIGHAVSHIGKNAYFRCTEKTIYDNAQNLQEYQANLFAEMVIMPDDLVKYRYEVYYNTKKPFCYIGDGDYCVGNQKVHIKSLAHLGWLLAKPLTMYFSNISKESLAYKMLNLGVIKNKTDECMRAGMGEDFSFCSNQKMSNIAKKMTF